LSKLRVLAMIFIVVVAALGIWVTSTGMRAGRTESGGSDTSDSAYDYEVRDVVVRQMGPDGSLQYELSAKQITQQPKSGQITATELIMHRDPTGSAPDGPNRLTLTADRADLPEVNGAITLVGNVRAKGRLQNSRAQFSVATEQLQYNLLTQDISADSTVDFTWGASRFRCGSLTMNIKRGTGAVESNCNGTYAP
jgi:LPS export ABC transporter protein LptC